MNNDFVPKSHLPHIPNNHCVWDLPVKILDKQSLVEFLTTNITQLESPFNEYAKERVLTSGDSGRITAHCCNQAIHTLKEVLLSIGPLP